MLPNTNRVLYLFSFSFHGLKLFLLEYRFNGIDEFLHGSLERRDAHARQTVLVGVQVCCVDSSTDQLHQNSPHCDHFAARLRCLVQPTHVGEKILQVWMSYILYWNKLSRVLSRSREILAKISHFHANFDHFLCFYSICCE